MLSTWSPRSSQRAPRDHGFLAGQWQEQDHLQRNDRDGYFLREEHVPVAGPKNYLENDFCGRSPSCGTFRSRPRPKPSEQQNPRIRQCDSFGLRVFPPGFFEDFKLEVSSPLHTATAEQGL